MEGAFGIRLPDRSSDSSVSNIQQAAFSGTTTDGGQDKCEGELLKLCEGFGFIRCRQYPNNVFFHWSALTNKDFAELQPGRRVRFLAVDGEKGAVARDIEVLD
ncbi:MAG: cold shock domain-containing protein [Phycisphaerales bacterium]|nr:cold shock domain-containing protein [Phycisphaerales bacterium]